MELLKHDFKIKSRSDKIRVYLLADFHIGSAGCDHKLLERDIRHILNDDDGYAILGGDMIEAIRKKDRRHDAAAVHKMFREKDPRNIIGQQLSYTEKILTPLYNADKILVIGEGNHERKYADETDFDPIAQLCARFKGVPYGSYSFVLLLKFDRDGCTQCVKIHWHHGKRGGSTRAGKVRASENQSRVITGCDIYARGHGHLKNFAPDEEVSIALDRDCMPFEKSRKIWLCSTGAYVRTLKEGHSSYGEIAEYEPVDLGCIYAEITPHASKRINGKCSSFPRVEIRDLVL